MAQGIIPDGDTSGSIVVRLTSGWSTFSDGTSRAHSRLLVAVQADSPVEIALWASETGPKKWVADAGSAFLLPGRCRLWVGSGLEQRPDVNIVCVLWSFLAAQN